MRESKKKKGGYVSRHAAPDKSARRTSRRDRGDEGDYAIESLLPEAEYDEYDAPMQADAPEAEYDDAAQSTPQAVGGDEEPAANEAGKRRGRRERRVKRARNAREAEEADEAENGEEEQYSPEDVQRAQARRDGSRRVKITLLILTVIFIVLGGAATVLGYMVTNSPNNLPNIYVDGVAVGGMTRDAAAAAIEASGWDDTAGVPMRVKLMDAVTFEVDRYASGAKYTVEGAADAAYAYGHTGNWYLNLFEYIKSYALPVDVGALKSDFDKDYIAAQIASGIEELDEALGNGEYEIDKESSKLCMVKGAGQFKFDTAAMTEDIIDALKADEAEMRYAVLAQEPKMPDFDAIHKELSAEPADAYYTDDNTFTVVDEIVGCEFDVEEAEGIWTAADNAARVEIPIDLTFPEVTGEYLRGLLFRDKLGGMTTYFPNSSDDRISNIKLACSKINETVLYPGDVFSYNDALGERTEAAGFKMAGAYSNGEVVQELGGGICQVSSTLYSAMLYSYGVNTVERSPHYFPVDYLEKGYDATVSWPTPDFKFRNDTAYPIRIAAYCDEYQRDVTIEIWGTNLDGTYIELAKDTYSYSNDRYPWIMEGHGVQMHRLVFDANGIQIDQVDEIYDVYHTHEATDQIKALDAAAKAQAEAAAAAGLAPMQ